jgi:hypothetical protein
MREKKVAEWKDTGNMRKVRGTHVGNIYSSDPNWLLLPGIGG